MDGHAGDCERYCSNGCRDRLGLLHRALTDVIARWEVDARLKGEVMIGRSTEPVPPAR